MQGLSHIPALSQHAPRCYHATLHLSHKATAGRDRASALRPGPFPRISPYGPCVPLLKLLPSSIPLSAHSLPLSPSWPSCRSSSPETPCPQRLLPPWTSSTKNTADCLPRSGQASGLPSWTLVGSWALPSPQPWCPCGTVHSELTGYSPALTASLPHSDPQALKLGASPSHSRPGPLNPSQVKVMALEQLTPS